MRIFITVLISLSFLSCDQFIVPAPETTKTNEVANVDKQKKPKKRKLLNLKESIHCLMMTMQCFFLKNMKRKTKKIRFVS